jgi:hypothetical protein
MIDPPLLRARDSWERVIEGWVDNTHAEAFTHTVRLVDPTVGLELSAVALPSPSYLIREARLRPLLPGVDRAVLDGIPKLAGIAMVAGLGRRVAELTGGGAGAGPARDAVIEIARLARQVAKLPRDRAVKAAGDPWASWQLDTTGWTDLPDSCFTYSEAGRKLFGTRRVSTPMTADLYSPRPGQGRVFTRKKVARLARRANRLALSHSMYDNVHGFELTLEVELDTGRVVRADGFTPRLPYAGICSEPQRKLGRLVGEVVDEGLPRRIQTLLGGASGCAQLYDLTADLLRLLAFDTGVSPGPGVVAS